MECGLDLLKTFDVQYFINKLKLSSYNKEMLSFLIRDEKDLNVFIRDFWGDYDNQFFSIADFRIYKIKRLDIQLNDFLKSSFLDLKKSLENLFQRRIHQKDIDLLLTRIHEDKITLEELFHNHKSNPSYPIQRFIL